MSEQPPEPHTPSTTRRELFGLAITGTVATVGLAALYPIARFVTPVARAAGSSVSLGPAEEFPRSSARTALLGERPIVVTRDADGSFRAFVALCTHLGCVVRHVEGDGSFECACHRGRYAADGRNVAGPPTRPLDSLEVAVVDHAVVVSAP